MNKQLTPGNDHQESLPAAVLPLHPLTGEAIINHCLQSTSKELPGFKGWQRGHGKCNS